MNRSMTAGFFRGKYCIYNIYVPLVQLKYALGAQAVVITYDIGNRQSFEKLTDWIQNIKLSTSTNCVIAICGNKIDIDSKLRQVSKEEGKIRADQENYLFFEASAKDGIDVDEMFTQIANKISEVM